MVEIANDLFEMVRPFLEEPFVAEHLLDGSDDKEEKCAIIWL